MWLYCFFFPLFNKIDLSAFKALSALMLFQKYAFSLSPKKHRSIRVHTTVLMRFRLTTLKRSKTIELHAPVIFSVIIFFLTCFRLSRRKRHVCVFVLIHFQQRFQIDAPFYENARRISVNGRPKRAEMYAFSNKNALV